MNYLDIILIIPLLWGIFRGFMRGLVMQLATLIAFTAGIWAAVHYNNQAVTLLKDKAGMTSDYVAIIAFILCFALVLLLVFATAKIVELTMKAAALGLVNKILGAVFGFLKYAFLTCLLVFVMDQLNERMGLYDKKVKDESLLYKHCIKIPGLIYPNIEDIFEAGQNAVHSPNYER